MFTVCIAIFASLVAVDPADYECVRVNQVQVRDLTAQCAATDKDPLTTCETQRMGATKYYIRIRRLAGNATEAPAKAVKEEV